MPRTQRLLTHGYRNQDGRRHADGYFLHGAEIEVKQAVRCVYIIRYAEVLCRFLIALL